MHIKRIFPDFSQSDNTEEILETKPALITKIDNIQDLLFSYKELNQKLNTLDACETSLRIFKNAKPVRVESHDQLSKEFRDGASIIFEGYERHFPKLARLCDSAQALFWRTAFINGILTPATQNSCFSTHADRAHIIIFQLMGKKKWRFLPPTGEPVNYRDKSEEVDIPDMSNATEVIMEPGDVYLVPEGWWHDAQLVGNEPSMHLGLILECFDALDYNEWFIKNQISDKTKYQKMNASHLKLKTIKEEISNNLSNYNSLESIKEFQKNWVRKLHRKLKLNIIPTPESYFEKVSKDQYFQVSSFPFIIEDISEDEFEMTIPEGKVIEAPMESKEAIIEILNSQEISINNILEKHKIDESLTRELFEYLYEEGILFQEGHLY